MLKEERKMKFKQLRHIVDELHRGYPEIDDAEVRINVGHSVVGFDEICHFIKEDMVVLFSIRERPSGPWRSSLGQGSIGREPLKCNRHAKRKIRVALNMQPRSLEMPAC